MDEKRTDERKEDILRNDDYIQADTNITNLLQYSTTESFDRVNEDVDIEINTIEKEISFNYGKEKDVKSNLIRMKFSVYKNLIVLALSFLCIFTAYGSLEMLQSSLNVAGSLGLIGLTVLYSCKLLSSLFLPSFVFSKLGMKWTIVVATFGYIAYIAASFHATWGTLIPSSVLLGIGASNLWTGQMSYVSTLARQYASISGLKFSNALSRVFSIFYTIYHTGRPKLLFDSFCLTVPFL